MATAPRLQPGFSRTWPGCVGGMRLVAEHLLALGAAQHEVEAALARDFPGAGATPAVAARIRGNVVAVEKMRQQANPSGVQLPDWDCLTLTPPEPTAHDLQVVASPVDVLRILDHYGISAQTDGDAILLSRDIDPDGPLYACMKRHRDGLIQLLDAEEW